jgi:hypothetical protein
MCWHTGASGALLLRPSADLSALLPSSSCDPVAVAASQLHAPALGLVGGLLAPIRAASPTTRHQQVRFTDARNHVMLPLPGCQTAAYTPCAHMNPCVVLVPANATHSYSCQCKTGLSLLFMLSMLGQVAHFGCKPPSNAHLCMFHVLCFRWKQSVLSACTAGGI